MDYENSDVLVAVLPFLHIYGHVLVMLSRLLRGPKLVTLQKFDPTLYLHNLQEHASVAQCIACGCVPV